MTHGDDDRFIHDGLSFWLRELLCDDTGRRDRAADVLGRMHCELTREILADKSFDTEAHVEVFNAAVRETLDGPDLDAKEYVERLVDFIVTAQNEQTRLIKEENERPEIDEGVVKTLGTIGPAAHEALPILEKLALEPREEEDYDEEDAFEEEDFEDEDELDEEEDIEEEQDIDDEDSDEPDFLAVAIARIRGE